MLDVDTEGHGGLFLVADKARPILRGEQSVILREAGVVRPRRGREAAFAPAGQGAGKPGRRFGGQPGGEPGGQDGGRGAWVGPEPGQGAGQGAAPEGLFGALRSWRATEAKAQAIPPYVIFHDTVLRDIAAVRPQTLEELGQIKGVGASKLERYGLRVLTVLTEARA